jgi:catechol 2,3-dioxygenase-like lactoylglutathione lyase family enzyme
VIRGIHHLTLMVRDIPAEVRFFEAAAGQHCLAGEAAEALALSCREADGSAARRTSALLAGPNGYLLLFEADAAAVGSETANPINRAGIRHFCIQNHDCTLLDAGVHRGGGSLIAPPLDLGTGNQYAYARDPEANIMEIEGLPYAPAGKPTWLAHVAIVTRDMDRACAFYEGLLESRLKRRADVGPGLQFDRMGGLTDAKLEGAWLPAGNLQLELWQFHHPESPAEPQPRTLLDPGYSMMSLETDNLEHDAARLVGIGGVWAGTMTENPHARAVVCSDPEGNLIELVEFTDAGRKWAIAATRDPDLVARIEAER